MIHFLLSLSHSAEVIICKAVALVALVLVVLWWSLYAAARDIERR
jgi:hypothetical protein